MHFYWPPLWQTLLKNGYPLLYIDQYIGIDNDNNKNYNHTSVSHENENRNKNNNRDFNHNDKDDEGNENKNEKKNENVEPSLKILFEAILECVKFGRKEVYESACKLCGQLISNVRQIRIDNDNNNNNNNNNNNDNYYNDYTSLSPYCHKFSNLLLSKIEGKFNLKDGIDNIATCICLSASIYEKLSLFVEIEIVREILDNILILSKYK